MVDQRQIEATDAVMTLFAVVCLLGGVFGVGWGGLKLVTQELALGGTQTVDGTVEASSVRVVEDRDPDGPPADDQYAVDVRYVYTVDDRQYTGTNVYPGFTGEQFNTRSEAKAVADRFQAGESVTVYVHLDDPSRSFLIAERRLVFPLISGLVGVLALVVGAAMWFVDAETLLALQRSGPYE